MSDVVGTFPGRSGDALLQFPVMFQWAKQTGRTFDCWLDEMTCKPLETLFGAQPCVDQVRLIGGVENWSCGGQPFHMNLETSAFAGRTIYHLGFRSFPARQITLETLENAKLPIAIDREALAAEPCFVFEPLHPKRRLVLHGQPICPHTRSTPGFWRFLAAIAPELPSLFEEVVWVGDARDREIGARTYPDWKDFDDGGAFLNTARLMASSACVIACGSSMAALASVLKVPCIRVHDPIGEAPRVIWDGLGPNQLNRTEIELRGLWPAWRDRWLVGVTA